MSARGSRLIASHASIELISIHYKRVALDSRNFSVGVIAIKVSQKDSILEVGYLKSRGASHEASSKYTIRFLNEDDLQDAMKLQEIVLHNLKDSEIYHPASQEILKEYLNKRIPRLES